LAHLRLNWQVMLMPIFLWGFFLSQGELGPNFWLGLFVFHVLFYGGSVAFNSYYDQDEGPIGGLWAPPRPTRALLVFSLVIQAVGMGLVTLINWPLLVVSLVMFALSTAYSHPAIRLKARPWASLLTVSLGQGVGGALAGWFCGHEDAAHALTTLVSWRAGLGLLVSALVTTGFYPLTQLYQRAEDRARGDITFAVRFGERCFPFAIACMAAGAVTGAILVARAYRLWEAALVGASLLGLAGLIAAWWRKYDESQIRQNYLRMMRVGYVMSSGFIAYVGWHLVWPGG
jgi:4-hydroxybenzoate polyprenyltransferase